MATTANNTRSLSIIIPAKDEADNLDSLLPQLWEHFGNDVELFIVDDGSADGTGEKAAAHGAQVIRHPQSLGNGAAVKAGARAATGAVLLFMDADGQHGPKDAKRLLARLDQGYVMAVGARARADQANQGRALANAVYNRLATVLVGQQIDDLTSGFRAVYRDRFLDFLFMLPNGFSYPTTITMAFFRSGYPVAYVPIEAKKRVGKSHIRATRDGLRFLLVIFRVATLYSPLKVFVPASGGFFTLGLLYYLYTYITAGQFTNMGALLFLMSAFVFLVGLISEQATMLLYQNANRRRSTTEQRPTDTLR